MDSSPRAAAPRTSTRAALRDDRGATPSELGHDPLDPAFIGDPYPALARLRGAPLAKMEFDILFRRMLSDLPTMQLVVDPRWKPRFILRGPDSLPVRT
jgi:hypothetical protein